MVNVRRQNLELKVRYADLTVARDRVLALGARHAGHEVQIDTFFHVPNGRLKLREIEDQAAVLIWYERPELTTARLSQYYLLPAPEPALTKTLLREALGIRGVVRKQRAIYLWHNVRIHLDQVDGLGSFLEFEAVLAPDDDLATAQQRLEVLCRTLAVTPADCIPGAYADLLAWQ